jgi:multidrug efflux pump subunit AcrB
MAEFRPTCENGQQRKPVAEALVEAGRLRLRPIVMTALAAILAPLPLAVGTDLGASMLQPLAIAIIAGLVPTLPAVPLLLPVLISLARGGGCPATERE